jgi:peptidoglycan/xylan/chitin deacetylase (PgdA/CDA1 family)
MREAAPRSDLAADAESALTILLYHGVTETASTGIENYSGKHIAAATFAAQMKTLRRHCAVLSIDEVVELLREGKPLPRRAVAVSFDDGFANNYTIAAPILDDMRVPAVFYVSSGIVNTDLMFWVDELEDCLNLTAARHLTVVLDQPCEFPLARRDERIRALEAIKNHCKRAPSEEKDRILADVKGATGIEPQVEHATNYRKIAWAQLRAMAGNPLFTVGGHSLYHDILSGLPPARMRDDVRLSISLLAYQLRIPIRHYSYPEGQAHHFNAQVIEELKHHGVVCCPSAMHGLNPQGTDPFHLRRVMVGIHGGAFPFEHLTP